MLSGASKIARSLRSTSAFRKFPDDTRRLSLSSSTTGNWPFVSSNVQDNLSSKPIRILYGTQTGTAQVLSMQLEEELQQVMNRQVETMALDEYFPPDMLEESFINVILTSVSGAGRAPVNAEEFYDWLTTDADTESQNWSAMHYAVFGLGNQIAFPDTYNVIGKSIDRQLDKFGARRIQDMGFGDDSGCIEDDFDVWKDQFARSIHATADTTYSKSNDLAPATAFSSELPPVLMDPAEVEELVVSSSSLLA